MNSKLIAIIAVVAMCGAALVGVGYAYNAAYQTPQESISTDVSYVYIDTNGETAFEETTKLDVKYDTLETSTSKYINFNKSNPASYIVNDKSADNLVIVKGNTITLRNTNVNAGSLTLNYSCIVQGGAFGTDVFEIGSNPAEYAGKVYLGYVLGTLENNSTITLVSNVNETIPMGTGTTITFFLIFESSLSGDSPGIDGYESYKPVSKYPADTDVSVNVQLLFKATA